MPIEPESIEPESIEPESIKSGSIKSGSTKRILIKRVSIEAVSMEEWSNEQFGKLATVIFNNYRAIDHLISFEVKLAEVQSRLNEVIARQESRSAPLTALVARLDARLDQLVSHK